MGKLPYGFTVADDGVQVVSCAAEQTVLQRSALLRGQGYSLRQVAALLNAASRCNRHGRRWNHVLLHAICQDLNQRLTAT